MSPNIAQFTVCGLGRVHCGLNMVVCFRHFSASHYHHYGRLLTGIEHIYMLVEYLVDVYLISCLSYRLPFIVITIYGVLCIQLAHLSIGDWKDISIAHVIIIIKSEVSTFPIVIIFILGCVRCLVHHILSLIACTFHENQNFVYMITVQFMMSANNRIRFSRSYSFFLYIRPSRYHHCANTTEDIEFIKCLSYIGLCVFSLPISLVMIERIYILFLIIMINSEEWTKPYYYGTVVIVIMSIRYRFIISDAKL